MAPAAVESVLGLAEVGLLRKDREAVESRAPGHADAHYTLKFSLANLRRNCRRLEKFSYALTAARR
jgi:chorismate synthase